MAEIIWIVSANAAHADIYILNRKALLQGMVKLKLINTYEHPESRKKDSDLVTDRLGNFRSSVDGGYGDFAARTDPKRHEAEVFAIQLADLLESGRVTQQYSELILITPAHFLGLLKKHLNHNIHNLVKFKIEKDYTHIPILRFKKYLSTYLSSN
jgi:protein required for attachment to host cells